jgi:hypothetical protein
LLRRPGSGTAASWPPSDAADNERKLELAAPTISPAQAWKKPAEQSRPCATKPAREPDLSPSPQRPGGGGGYGLTGMRERAELLAGSQND